MGSKVFWAVVFGFLLGVFARSFVPLGFSVIAFLALLGGGVVLLSITEHHRHFIVLGVAFLSCALGLWRMGGAVLTGDPVLTERVGSKVVLDGVIVAEPDVRATGVRATVRADTLVTEAGTTSVASTVIAALPLGTDVAYGERVRLAGTLALPSAFDTGEGHRFAYPEYLGKDGIAYVLDRAKLTKLAPPSYALIGTPNYVSAMMISFKQAYLRGLHAVLPQPEAGFAGGITVGAKRGIGQDLYSAFQRDSLSHVVVLSGYHINVVLKALDYGLRLLPNLARLGGGALAVVLFVLLSGGAGSAMRAGLMALVAIAAGSGGRIFLAERALAAAVFFMVLWDPWMLAFDIGFQLSALATLGLVLFSPIFSRYLAWVPAAYSLRTTVAATLSTQLTVLPLLLYQNGLLSFVSLPANILVLFPIPAAMFFSAVAGIAGMFAGHAAALVALPAYALLAYSISLARVLAALPSAAVTLPAFNAAWMFGAYTLVFAAYFVVKRHQ